MAEQETNKRDASAETVHCPTCGYEVRAQTARAASMVAGTIMVVKSCPDCKSILYTATNAF